MNAKTMKIRTAGAALGVVAAVVISGCSGGGSTTSGVFYGETKVGIDSIVTIDGDTVTWGAFSCDVPAGEIDAEDSDTSVGTLDKDRAQIAWTKTGNFHGTDPFTENEDGTVITINVGNYSKAGTTAGDAKLAEQTSECAQRAETQRQSEAARSEQAESDAKLKPSFDNALAALLKAADAGTLSTADTIYAQNGITADEFASYLSRHYNGMDARELLGMLQSNPAQARALLEESSGL